MSAERARKCKLVLGLVSTSLFAAFLYFICFVRVDDFPGQQSFGAALISQARTLCAAKSLENPSQQDSDGVLPERPLKTKGNQSKTLESRLRRSEMVGPYAPMVYDMLVETSLESRLVNLGIIETTERLELDLLKALPARFPVSGKISSGFGTRKSPFSKKMVMHRGVDVSVPRGTPVNATGEGLVTYAGWYRGYGKLVELDHGYGIVSRYGHNERILVGVGERVSGGQAIALSGSSGRSTGPHVHYEVAVHGQEVDPSLVMFPHAESLLARAGLKAPTEQDDQLDPSDQTDQFLAIGGETDLQSLTQGASFNDSSSYPELLETLTPQVKNSLSTSLFGLMSCTLIFLVRRKVL
jgi:murein DD-endopeptidase MepM/ murein hydrolase activator NlpD